MNESVNPYASSSAPDVRTASRFSSFIMLAAGSWLAMAIGVAFGRYTMVTIFADFGIEPPAVTQLLIRPFAPIFFGAVAIGITLLALVIPSSQNRKRAALVAVMLAIPTGVICIYAFLGPLVVLIQQLG